jgi:outer membrane protein W
LRDRVDAALDVGGDVNLDKRRFVNADIKYITPLESDPVR